MLKLASKLLLLGVFLAACSDNTAIEDVIVEDESPLQQSPEPPPEAPPEPPPEAPPEPPPEAPPEPPPEAPPEPPPEAPPEPPPEAPPEPPPEAPPEPPPEAPPEPPPEAPPEPPPEAPPEPPPEAPPEPPPEPPPGTSPYAFDPPAYLEDLGLSANVYYVSAEPGASDSNPGSRLAPFSSIQFAVDQLRQHPDYDLVILDGSYPETILINQLIGSVNDPVVIRAESPLGVVLESLEITKHKSVQNRPNLPDAGISIENSEHVKLAGIYVNGSRGFGIRVDNSSHILLKQNKTYNTGQSGIKANHVTDLDLMWNEVQRAVQVFNQECVSLEHLNQFRIIGNKIHDRPIGDNVYSLQSDYILTYPIGRNKAYYAACYSDNPYDFEATGLIRMQTTCATKGGEGLDVKDGSKHGEIAYNSIVGIEEKFGLYLDAWGIDDDGSALIQEDIDVHHNIVTGSGTGIGLSTENGSSAKGKLIDIRLNNNVVVKNQRSAFRVGDFGGQDGVHRIDEVRRIEDITLTNNMLVGNGTYGLFLENPNALNILIQNNVIAHNVKKEVFFAPAISSISTLPHPEYSIIHNLIDVEANDYDWLDGSVNNLVDLPAPVAGNDYLISSNAVNASQAGLDNDIDAMIQQLHLLLN